MFFPQARIFELAIVEGESRKVIFYHRLAQSAEELAWLLYEDYGPDQVWPDYEFRYYWET